MNKIRYAVVGMGHIAQVAVLPAFEHAENSELAALITGSPKKERALSQKYSVPAYPYDGFEDALVEQQVDAVYIALPNHLHREYTERAAKMGVHVLCEKPMATSEHDCRVMTRACAEADVRLMIAYRLHFADAHLRAIELAENGILGELRYFNSLFAMQVADKNVRVRSETGGGTLYDIGIYCINAAQYLFQDEPLEVLAAAATGDDSRFDEIEEMTSVLMRFRGERLANFTCSFGSADMDQLELVGTRGSLRIEPAYSYTEDVKWTLKIGDDVRERKFPAGDQFAAELIYFSDCICHGVDPEPSGAEGEADVCIINAIYQSACEGRPVNIGELYEDDRPDAGQEIKCPPVREPETVGAGSPHRG